jgi:hypothetical protein
VEIVACELDSGQVLLNLNTGNYYVLNATGHHIWSLIGEASTFGEICTAMFAAYEVDRDSLESELAKLIRDLNENGLVSLR